MSPQHHNDWRLVAKQLRNEEDPQKMMELVFELDRLLEREEKAHKQFELKRAA